MLRQKMVQLNQVLRNSIQIYSIDFGEHIVDTKAVYEVNNSHNNILEVLSFQL